MEGVGVRVFRIAFRFVCQMERQNSHERQSMLTADLANMTMDERVDVRHTVRDEHNMHCDLLEDDLAVAPLEENERGSTRFRRGSDLAVAKVPEVAWSDLTDRRKLVRSKPPLAALVV